MQNLTPTEQSIMVTIDALVQSGEPFTLAQVAEECSVAKSTVTKAVKKLGYEGFRDMVAQLSRPTTEVGENLLPEEFLVGDVLEEAQGLASLIWEMRTRKDIVCSSRSGTGYILPGYLSRKLAMFDIVCPATYDYATAICTLHEPGIAFLILHEGRPTNRVSGTPAEVHEPMLRLIRKEGYHLVAISDDPTAGEQVGADSLVLISPEGSTDLDLFAAKTTMFFEFVWSELSDLRDGEER